MIQRSSEKQSDAVLKYGACALLFFSWLTLSFGGMDYVASAFVFAPECAKVCSLSGRAFGRVSIRRSRGIIREVSCYGRPEAGATPEGAAPGEGLFMAYVGQDWMPVVDLLQGGLWLVLTACLLRVLKRAGSSGKEALK